jgi:predicted PurR-regulated permease PerM
MFLLCIENDKLVEQLSSSVKYLKENAMLMTNKLKNSNMHIEEMDKKYSESNNSLSKTIMQLKTLFSSISNSWFYAFIFIIVILFLLYKKIRK